MEIRADEISRIIREHVAGYDTSLSVQETGTVLTVGDGIARIYGLDNAMAGELLEFPHDVFGMVLNLEEDNVGVAILGNDEPSAKATRSSAPAASSRCPSATRCVGRVVNALGQPIDGKGPIASTENRRIELKAPGIVARQTVQEPLQTGIKAIDAMIPIGRGQRELIIGDRQTGKTAVALDTIINQKGGRTSSASTSRSARSSRPSPIVVDRLRSGAMEYTTVVAATASEPAPLQFIAPYTGVAMGEYFRDNGQHALHHLRRPFEAGGRVSPALAAASPPARPRGVSGRRLLPALPPARARRARSPTRRAAAR